MRIRFGNKTFLCTAVSYPKKSKLLIVTTSNGIYAVDLVTVEQAESAYNQLLVDGYFDASAYEYSN